MRIPRNLTRLFKDTEVFGIKRRLKDMLGGLSTKSFWPSLDSLTKMLNISGFEKFHVIYDEPAHSNGPRLTAVASSKD